MNQEELTPLLTTSLEIDRAGLEQDRERGDDLGIIDDRIIELLERENRIALAKGASRRVAVPGETEVAYHDVSLICVVHSHPECRFRWSRLKVDLRPTPGALIRDMVPRDIDGVEPVEMQTNISLGIKFETVAKVVGGEINPSYENKRTVYYPRISASGWGFTQGYWDFLALTTDYLHSNRELRLLLSAPAGAPVYARFNLRAKVALAGMAALIPLLARREGEIDQTYRLD